MKQVWMGGVWSESVSFSKPRYDAGFVYLGHEILFCPDDIVHLYFFERAAAA